MFESVPGPHAPFWLQMVRAGPHENFHYLIGDPASREAAAIDPAFELDALFALAEAEGYRVRQAWFTHGHWDHIGGIPEVFDHGVETIHVHEAVAAHPKVTEAGPRTHLFRDGDVLRLGDLEVECLHTPGHQPEGSCFLTRSAPPCLFGGDTLFVGSCGRTDFPGGDTQAMFASMARLRGLDSDTIVLPGHDYAEVPWRPLGDEVASNPALATTDPDAFAQLHCLTH